MAGKAGMESHTSIESTPYPNIQKIISVSQRCSKRQKERSFSSQGLACCYSSTKTFTRSQRKLFATSISIQPDIIPRHYPTIFIDVIDHITDPQLLVLALSALLYAMVRFVEAYGLWYHRQWAEWFGFLTGGMYIPVEIYELVLGVTIIKLTIFIVNVMVVALLGTALRQSGK